MTDEQKKQNETENLQKELRKAKELYELGQFNDAVNIADHVYQKSQALGDNVQTFDALMIKVGVPIYLGNLKTVPDLIKEGETLHQTFIDESLNEVEQKAAELLSKKGTFHYVKGELDKGIEVFQQVLTIQEKLGNKKKIAQTLGLIGDCLALTGEIDEALNYIKKSQILCEELDLKSRKARNLIALGAICFVYGNIERSFDLLNQSLKISEEINNKLLIALALNNLGGLHRIRGDLEQATKGMERCLAISEEIGFKFMVASVLDSLIQLMLEKGDKEQAKSYLKSLKIINEKEKTKITDISYRLNKALILKMSLRARDRADAEDLLKEVISEEGTFLEIKIVALLNLCDLLLKELQITGYIEILDEIQQYISQLLDISEKLHSYMFMAETYLLQARLSLLMLKLKDSKRFFTQARRIAEKWGLFQLSMNIEKEYKDFLKQMNIWENLKEKDAPLNERLELIRFDEQIERMLQNRSQLTGQIIEEKVEVHKEKKICMICKGEVLGHIYICECDTIYCENCLQALIDLENACWVCEIPIDQEKPIKHFKKDEVEIKDKNVKKIR